MTLIYISRMRKDNIKVSRFSKYLSTIVMHRFIRYKIKGVPACIIYTLSAVSVL
jgi:hypothetical protein